MLWVQKPVQTNVGQHKAGTGNNTGSIWSRVGEVVRQLVAKTTAGVSNIQSSSSWKSLTLSPTLVPTVIKGVWMEWRWQWKELTCLKLYLRKCKLATVCKID